MQVQALEALIAYQVEVGEFMAPYYIWLYDGGKYGHGVLGHYWEQEVIHYGAILEYEDPNTGEMSILQTTEEVMGYEGNKVYNLSPYDFMHDPRVTIGNFQKGEFCVSRRRMGWSDILRREKAGYFHNLDRIREHLGNDQGASEGSSQLKRPDFSKSILHPKVDESLLLVYHDKISKVKNQFEWVYFFDVEPMQYYLLFEKILFPTGFLSKLKRYR